MTTITFCFIEQYISRDSSLPFYSTLEMFLHIILCPDEGHLVTKTRRLQSNKVIFTNVIRLFCFIIMN